VIGFVLIIVALVCGLAVLFGVALGELTPHLIGLALVCLAAALLIGFRAPWGANRVP
jgi:hypothetical protein